MPDSVHENGNGTPRSSHLSPTSPSATLSPTWRPPKSPLPPHRLAKLANALGVSTPIPSHSPTTIFLSRSFSESSSSAEQFRRSPTPSTAASSMGFTSYMPSTSKFLLHVIPPKHLPHDADNSDDSQMPTPNAPGYHTQFRRGTLVPVHSTLQAQLGVIAKEYALPSTAGLILYLVTTTTSPLSPSPQPSDGMDEPGPRLSEDIWRHLWTRVLRTEQREDTLMPSRSPTPHTPLTPQLLGYGPAARSTPFLPQEGMGPLRPFISSPGPEPLSPHAPIPSYPLMTTPSTPSSLSDIRSNNKSAPPSSTSVSQSDPGTPDTSVDESGANFLDLPGLNSPSLIPILAKVEFDIDRRKAGWYEPWLRSRKANHAKREGNRKGSKTQNEDGGPSEHVPIEFLTGKKKELNPFSISPAEEVAPEGIPDADADLEAEASGYAPLSESPEVEDMDSDSDGDYEEDFGEDATARVSSLAGGKDPLDDVFGTDADAWADLHATNGGDFRHSNPNVVNLALTAAEIAALPDPTDLEDDNVSTQEEDDVREMLDLMSKPSLAISIPLPPKEKRSSSPTSMSNNRRNVPPPLVLVPKDKAGAMPVPSTPTPMSQAGDSMGLAYLGNSSPEDEEPASPEEEDFTRVRSPEESEKRGGAVYDDLDLGLDPTEDFDEGDPNDRRRSQYLMRAQLDEIERTMAQLSPRILKADLEEENTSFQTLSPGSPGKLTLSPGSARNSNFFPSSPRLPQHPEPPENAPDLTGQSWPAVPFSSIKNQGAPTIVNANDPPSPPRLAVNGVTTSAPRSYMPTRQATSGSSESERRKKELEDEQALYPPGAQGRDSSSQSPIIPLSPDPFGRYSSTQEPPANSLAANWDNIGRTGQAIKVDEAPVKGRARSGTTASSSRFSADSVTGEEPSNVIVNGNSTTKALNRATLMSVKTIKKLWRKSNNKSTSSTSTLPPIPATPTATSSGRSSPMFPPQRPERPSQESLDLPDVADMPARAQFGRLSPQPHASEQPVRTSQDQMSMHKPRRPSQEQQNFPPPPPRRSQDSLNAQHPQSSQGSFGRISPQPMASQQPPVPMHHAHRPSQDQQNFPPPQRSQDGLGAPPPSSQGNFGRLSPQPHAPQQPGRLSQDQQQMQMQMHNSRQRPQDQYNMPPPRPSQEGLGAPPQPPLFQQLNVPGRGPIISTHMQPSRSSNLDRLHFDQESPYPIRRSPPNRTSPRPPSPPPLPAIPEQEKNTARKSILKWKSSTNTSSGTNTPLPSSEPQPRSSFERPGVTGNSRGRRPSVINFGSTRASVTSPDLLPPSPPIPNNYIHKNDLDRGQSQRSRLTTSSTDSYSPPQRQMSIGGRPPSPQRSMTSSRDSAETRPSFDASQFEIVSPKGGTLNFPYHGLDH